MAGSFPEPVERVSAFLRDAGAEARIQEFPDGTHTAQDAADAVGCELAQETFLKAWEGLPGLREPSRFAGWLYRIATNCAYTYQHYNKHLQLVPWDVYSGDNEEKSVVGPEEQFEETELLKLALARVSPTYRPCLILYVIEELPQRRIADLLKMKESSVSKYVSRGKEELRQVYFRLVKDQDAPARGRR